MNKLTRLFETVDVTGPPSFAVVGVPHSEVYIEFVKAEDRDDNRAVWSVSRLGSEMPPTIFRFPSGTAPKKQARDSAMKWAGERFGISEWARTPFGTWMEASFVKQRIEKLIVAAGG